MEWHRKSLPDSWTEGLLQEALQSKKQKGTTMTRMLTSAPAKAALALTFVFIFGGCGTTAHDAKYAQDFVPSESAKIMIGQISDTKDEGGDQEGDFDTENELRTQLEGKLSENGLLATGAAGEEYYVLSAEIVDYEPGSAAKRWLWPGYGATELSVQCTLSEGDRKVGNVFARRTVEGGGLYTAGAWKSIFDTVAGDVVEEIKSKLGV